MWVTEVHDAINNTFFHDSGVSAEWHGLTVNVAAALRFGSGAVDSVTNQLFGPCYQHAMWSPSESYEEAVAGYNQFIANEVQLARNKSDQARSGHWYGGFNSLDIFGALDHLGRAMHAFSDNFAPSHTGFQIWNPPNPVLHPFEFETYVSNHRSQEKMVQYNPMRAQVMSSLLNKFKNDLIYIMKE